MDGYVTATIHLTARVCAIKVLVAVLESVARALSIGERCSVSLIEETQLPVNSLQFTIDASQLSEADMSSLSSFVELCHSAELTATALRRDNLQDVTLAHVFELARLGGIGLAAKAYLQGDKRFISIIVSVLPG